MLRPTVDFIIIGAQKAGTTAAAYNLGLHPDIEVFNGKTKFGQYELEFYNQHWTEGEKWYRSNFSYARRLTGEKTAELLHRLITHRRIQHIAPQAKLIVLLRSPVERAFSQWKMATRPNWGEDRAFERVVETEMECLDNPDKRREFDECLRVDIEPWREGYIRRGLYVEHLEHLFQHFPREQVHIAISERVRTDMTTEYNRIFTFLAVRECSLQFVERFVGNPALCFQPQTRSLLAAFYQPYNDALRRLIGDAIPEW